MWGRGFMERVSDRPWPGRTEGTSVEAFRRAGGSPTLVMESGSLIALRFCGVAWIISKLAGMLRESGRNPKGSMRACSCVNGPTKMLFS